MPFDGVQVDGLRDLTLAFRELSVTAATELKAGLVSAAEPVREDAERLAVEKIRNIDDGDTWALMRVGVTADMTYVAPKQRGRRGRDDPAKRPNLAGLLLERALEPALDENEPAVIARSEAVLAHAIKRAGF